jgi:hypothetical protein
MINGGGDCLENKLGPMWRTLKMEQGNLREAHAQLYEPRAIKSFSAF